MYSSNMQYKIYPLLLTAIFWWGSGPLADSRPIVGPIGWVLERNSCISDDIDWQLECLRNMGLQIDRLTAEYFRLTKDIQAKLNELVEAEARCKLLRERARQRPDAVLFQQISQNCEGSWLRDRLARFNNIKDTYERIKGRYDRIKSLHEDTRVLMEAVEDRQREVERQYYDQLHRGE
ncbi:hypothetical protein TI04_01960 [Achromatium sp. WMS2]|nr:hypothetical protein TI04_01960 [Achromatium sp. WMS2]